MEDLTEYRTSSKLVSPITQILHKTIILNASLGLKDYNVENYQKKNIENVELFTGLLYKYIPDCIDKYYSHHEIRILNRVQPPIIIRENIENYRESKNLMLSILITNILHHAMELRNHIINISKEKKKYCILKDSLQYKEEKKYTRYDIVYDITGIMVQLGIPKCTFDTYCKKYDNDLYYE